MEPENNIAKTEPVAERVAPVADRPKDDIVFTDKSKKKGKGTALGMALLALLAAGGIGFGVWAYLTKNHEATTLNNQISELQTQLASQQSAPEISSNDISNNQAINSKDYIYIGEWGVKIKIPEILSGKIGYLISGDFLEIIDNTEVTTFNHPQIDWTNTTSLSINRNKTGVDWDSCVTSCPQGVITLNGYDYAYSILGSNPELMKSSPFREMATKEAFSEI